MKMHTVLIYVMALLLLLSCKESAPQVMPQLAQFEYSKNNVEITYRTIRNFKDNAILTAIEKQNYNYIFGYDSAAHMDIAAAAKELEENFTELANE